MAKRSTTLIGASGEHYVMYRLLGLNKIAALAPTGADAVDILVCDKRGGRLASIQVKTSGNPVTVGWRMRDKHEAIVEERLFYCFIDPGEHGEPTCWIVPSAVVAQHVARTHSSWLNDKTVRPGSRKDGSGRKMHLMTRNPPLPEYASGWMDRYREAWHLLD